MKFMRAMEKFLGNINRFVNTYELLPAISGPEDDGLGCSSKIDELKTLVKLLPSLRRYEVPAYEGNLVETIELVERIYRVVIDKIDQLQAEYFELTEDYYFVNIFSKSNSANGIIFQKRRAIDTLQEKREEVT